MKDRLSRTTELRRAFRLLHQSGCFVLPKIGRASCRERVCT